MFDNFNFSSVLWFGQSQSSVEINRFQMFVTRLRLYCWTTMTCFFFYVQVTVHVTLIIIGKPLQILSFQCVLITITKISLQNKDKRLEKLTI